MACTLTETISKRVDDLRNERRERYTQILAQVDTHISAEAERSRALFAQLQEAVVEYEMAVEKHLVATQVGLLDRAESSSGRKRDDSEQSGERSMGIGLGLGLRRRDRKEQRDSSREDPRSSTHYGRDHASEEEEENANIYHTNDDHTTPFET
ncbi:hypothetical protein HK097_002553, partial [Rhizophlyctis rosea]